MAFIQFFRLGHKKIACFIKLHMGCNRHLPTANEKRTYHDPTTYPQHRRQLISIHLPLQNTKATSGSI